MTDQAERPPWSTDAWREKGGKAWLDQADPLEAMLAPVLDPLNAHADLQPGDTVLDVGCGRGATTFAAAELVGPNGAVTAVDVSPDLIAEASASTPQDGSTRAPIEWRVGDAQRTDLGDGLFDAVMSRFGVMFFDDPVAAFANLRKAARPGGRLTIATWRPRDDSEFLSVGWGAIFEALTKNGYEVPESDPAGGPFSFGVDAVLRSTLGDAGWHDVAIHPVDLALYFGGPGTSTEEAVELAMSMGGLQEFLALYDARATELAADALREAYSVRHDGTGVVLQAAVVITTAVA